MKKRCRHCKKTFEQDRPEQLVCSVECAAVYGPKYMHKRRKEALKTTSQHLADLQKIFNRYIRMRDQHLPCVSCGRHHRGQYHAGHYKPVGGRSGAALRFCEDNVAKQCSVCNNHHSGQLTGFRQGLIERIGLERVEWLEGPHDAKKWSVEEINALKAEYRQKIKAIETYFPDSKAF